MLWSDEFDCSANLPAYRRDVASRVLMFAAGQIVLSDFMVGSVSVFGGKMASADKIKYDVNVWQNAHILSGKLYCYLIDLSNENSPDFHQGSLLIGLSADYSWGPASTRALPASLPVYFTKFLMKRAARSSAFLSHSVGSA